MSVQSIWYMKRLLQSKKSLVSYMKPWTEARNNKYMKYYSKLTYQFSFWNVSRKVDYQYHLWYHLWYHQYHLWYFNYHYHHYNKHYLTNYWQLRNLWLPFHYLPKFRRNLQVCSFNGLSVCLSVCYTMQVAVFDQSSSNFIHICSLAQHRSVYFL